jgi:hypothetical protein
MSNGSAPFREHRAGSFNNIKPLCTGWRFTYGTTSVDLSGQCGWFGGYLRPKYSSGRAWAHAVPSTEWAGDRSKFFWAIAGFRGPFEGQANSSRHNAMFGKYDPDGNLAWLKQFGDPDVAEAQALAVAGDRLYVAGWSYIVPFGGTHRDAFVRAYSTLDGAEVWAQSYVTDGDDIVGGIAVDNSAVYVTGHTNQTNGIHVMYLKTYSLSGVEGWSAIFQAANSIFDQPQRRVLGRGVRWIPARCRAQPSQWPNGFIKTFNLDGTEVRAPVRHHTRGILGDLRLAVDSSGVYLSG